MKRKPSPPPPAPDDFAPEGRACWESLVSRMPDIDAGDIPTLKMAVHWHCAFLNAAKAANEATDEGQRWKHQTAQAMASKQYSALLRLLGLAKRFRLRPSPIDGLIRE